MAGDCIDFASPGRIRSPWGQRFNLDSAAKPLSGELPKNISLEDAPQRTFGNQRYIFILRF